MSRLHAFFRKSGRGDFLLEDNASKFGTLIQIRKPYMLPHNFPNYLQLGRSILEIIITTPNKYCSQLFSSCCPTLFPGKAKKARKVQKGLLSYDLEGDFYPCEFALKVEPQFTVEAEGSQKSPVPLIAAKTVKSDRREVEPIVLPLD